MRIAGFEENDRYWIRQVTPQSSVTAHPANMGGMEFKLNPSIGNHDTEAHVLNAATAAVVFKVAMTLAEMANATVMQGSLMGECQLEAGMGNIILARYPLEPLLFANLCLGFRAVLMAGVPQERTE